MCVELIFLAAEAMHVERPLQADDSALDRSEQRQGQNDGQRHPDGEMLPGRQRAVASTPMKAPRMMWPTMTTTR